MRGQPRWRWRENIKENTKRHDRTEYITEDRWCWESMIMPGSAEDIWPLGESM